jgi:hypothetical protein
MCFCSDLVMWLVNAVTGHVRLRALPGVSCALLISSS